MSTLKGEYDKTSKNLLILQMFLMSHFLLFRYPIKTHILKLNISNLSTGAKKKYNFEKKILKLRQLLNSQHTTDGFDYSSLLLLRQLLCKLRQMLSGSEMLRPQLESVHTKLLVTNLHR